MERLTSHLYVGNCSGACSDTQSSEVIVTEDSRENGFLELVQRVSECSTCPRMSGRTRVLSRHNGNLHAKALFIAEAPGRLGADAYNIPLYGDQTGRNFDTLMNMSGIRREAVFITNAVLCNPRDEAGRNATPTVREVSSCACHLQATIELVRPIYIVTLGNIALQALNSIEAHSLRLSEHVGKTIDWNGRMLLPLYHPGSRARIHRSFDLQLSDFINLAGLLVNL